MNRISIYTSTTVSSKTASLIGTDQKPLLNNKNQNKENIFKSFPKSNINNINNFYQEIFSSKKNTIKKEDKSPEEQKSGSDKENFNSIQKDKKYNFSIERHKKISKLPYNIKNNEKLKIKYLNNNMKSQKLPKYSSDYIGEKLKKDIDFPNVNIINKKNKKSYLSCRKFSFISSDKKKFRQKYIFLNENNEYFSFGLYYDKDIIDKSKELDDELIENSCDMDVESDEEAKINGCNVCLFDLKYAFSKLNENNQCISYVKKNKVKLVNNN